MSELKHTPGPWTAEKQEDGYYAIWYDHCRTGATIAENIGEKANAEFIVRACNCFEEMVEIIETGLGVCLPEWENEARKILAKAKGS